MVIDYRESERAIAAQKLLAVAGVYAVYIPDKVVAVPNNPEMTVWIVQRLKVAEADAVRATALLKAYNFWAETISFEWE